MHRYGRRDGVRVGGGVRAELVNAEPVDSGSTEQRRRLLRIDAAYRDWVRNRSDVERLRRSQEAIGE